MTIFLGDGRGGLRAVARVPAGPHPTEMVAADFNRDGLPDLAVANHESTDLFVLLGDGKGGLRPAPGSPVRVHSVPHPHTLDACDADGDGDLDLVLDDWGENRLTLVRGDGRGGFAGPGEPIEVGRKPYRNLKARDFDGDGRCDIAAPSYGDGVVTLLRGDGRGGFRAAAPVHAGPAPFTVDAGDLDGDGHLDLAIQNYSGQLTDPSDDALTFLLGDGRGGFRLGTRIATGRAPFQVAVGGRRRRRLRRRRHRRLRRLRPDRLARRAGRALAVAHDARARRLPRRARDPRGPGSRRPRGRDRQVLGVGGAGRPARPFAPVTGRDKEVSVSTSENAALARKWFDEVWNQRRDATVVEMLADPCDGHTEGGPVSGPARVPRGARRAARRVPGPERHGRGDDRRGRRGRGALVRDGNAPRGAHGPARRAGSRFRFAGSRGCASRTAGSCRAGTAGTWGSC